jgi:hypothetical protein
VVLLLTFAAYRLKIRPLRNAAAARAITSVCPGWQALQSVGDQDLTRLVVTACEALASRV